MDKKIYKLTQNFAKNLKIERVAKGLTQKQVAEKLGIKVQSYQAYESGLATPTVVNLLKLVCVLNFSLDDIFEI